MHPAYSVIVFTTCSGAGYGMLAFLGLVGMAHGHASSFLFGATCLVIALALISIGLLSSMLHLGHPERAWRAFSQWRSSWLSREGVASVATYAPALVFGVLWVWPDSNPCLIATAGLLTMLMCIVTVHCTAMIYASLKTIRQWHNRLVPFVYQAFAWATGGLLLLFVAGLFGRGQPVQAGFALAGLVLCAVLKLLYWRVIDADPGRFTMGEATGLGRMGPVRQWEVPHTSANFVVNEMGYRVARRHALKLRRLVLLGLGLAALLAIPSVFWTGPAMTALAGLATAAAMAAALTERWLFFAEAQHVVTLYYGAARA